MKEDKFINLIKGILTTSSHFIGDDAAYIPELDLILTQDALIEDVHFRKSTISPFYLGIKSVAVNLSDIAASGGIPKYILISLSMPKNIEEAFVKDFYEGINTICNKYGVLVVGGDITGGAKISISIAVIGVANGIKPASRSYANPGDFVVATGEFGSSRAGLWLLENKAEFSSKLRNISDEMFKKFIDSHINPIPQLETGRKIVMTCAAPAMMDASDGLADALYKICLSSKVSMNIDYNLIPKNENLDIICEMAKVNPFNWVMYGGEDYQLIATVSPDCYKKIIAQKIPVKKIGEICNCKKTPYHVNVFFENKSIKIDSSNIEDELFNHFG